MSHSIDIFSIQVDTIALNQFNNIKLYFFASNMKRSFFHYVQRLLDTLEYYVFSW